MIVPIAKNTYVLRLKTLARRTPNPLVHQRFICLKLVDKPLDKTPATFQKTSEKTFIVKLLT